MEHQLNDSCTAFSSLIEEPRALLVEGDVGEVPQALRSALVLEGPGSLRENFLLYHDIDYTLAEANEILDTWKDKFFDVSMDYRCVLVTQVVFFVLLVGNRF